MNRYWGLLGFCLFICGLVFAEFRVWEGQNGSIVEAELVRVWSGTAELRKHDGKTVKVPVSKLSAKDQRYLVLANPPELKIKIKLELLPVDFSTRQNNFHLGLNLLYKCDVKIRKNNSQAYPSEIVIWVLLFNSNERMGGHVELIGAKEWTYPELPQGRSILEQEYEKELKARFLFGGENNGQLSRIIDGAVVLVLDANQEMITMAESESGLWVAFRQEKGLGDGVEGFLSEAKKVVNEKPLDDRLKESLFGINFRWGGELDISNRSTSLGVDGRVMGGRAKGAYWDVNDDGLLVIYNGQNKPQWIFTKQETRGGKLYFETDEGQSLLER